jgi:putative ABC transport system substrate-binding protein
MRRREFITFVGSAAVAWPFAARAQQTARTQTIGFLGASTQSATGVWADAFVQRLNQLGWSEGHNLAIVYRWADGKPERASAFAAELVRLGVSVIVTHANMGVAAAKQATSTVPIVFGAMGDPVDAGLVVSLTHPGGNITGQSLQQTEAAAKRLEILHELVPGLKRLGILSNTNNRAAMLEMDQVRLAARTLDLEITAAKLRGVDDILPAFDEFKGRVDALYFCNDPLLTANRTRLAILSAAARLPTAFNFRENVEAGGLLSYGPNVPELFRHAAEMVDKILRGTKPGDIPIEQPTKFDLIINLTTARALGINVPPLMLTRAEEVIE